LWSHEGWAVLCWNSRLAQSQDGDMLSCFVSLDIVATAEVRKGLELDADAKGVSWEQQAFSFGFSIDKKPRWRYILLLCFLVQNSNYRRLLKVSSWTPIPASPRAHDERYPLECSTGRGHCMLCFCFCFYCYAHRLDDGHCLRAHDSSNSQPYLREFN
jgi:hypothetical protein